MSQLHWTRLVRFVPKSDPNTILIGQPGDADLDVGIATRKGQDVEVTVFNGSSILSPGEATSRTETIGRLLSPLALNEVGSIRCIGLNYRQHANELSLPMPTVPTVFLKPATALADPYPEPTILPHITQKDDCGDYESELAVILSGSCKNVSEEDAMNYVLGYTAANDVSSRTSQFEQSQWTYSKGFDGSCPIGPCIVSPKSIPDPSKFKVRGLKNGECLQECGTDDLIFSIPKLISFLSQGTTLPAGTLIITGTPAGVGTSHKPAITIKDGDEFHVEILPHIGTLVNVFENEQ